MDIREIARNLYATIDARDWDRLAGLVSPDLAVHLASANPIGFDDWRKSLTEFFVGFPDGHHIIDDYIGDADTGGHARSLSGHAHRHLPRRRTERKLRLGCCD
ncbi:ester cyclase [Mesorhizobium sp.]|uniref:ester cyclase n=1 Tax=Mesorhizobium sp. TaxID=1871066 RepID=UPI00338F97CC